MATTEALTRIPSLKTVEAFRAHLQSLNASLPVDDRILPASESPLFRPAPDVPINGKIIGNRWAIQPMEGWDASTAGEPSPWVQRRWRRFGQSGAKLIWGGEAMAVRPDGRANPNQLILAPAHLPALAALREELLAAHKTLHQTTDDLIVGFQLTHSGRFCRPNDKKTLEPRIAFRHPILDRRAGIDSDRPVLSDDEVRRLIEDYARAARIARDAGADFVDIKHCHGYLLHEFLGAHTRPGPYGGSFENRTRILREIVESIRADGNRIEIGVRLSAFDMLPFRPDPARSAPGKPGPGIPEDAAACLPYRYGFGVCPDHPVEVDLDEPARFLELCATLGIKLVNLSAGSPYYNPHIQRPAAYPPSDGYQSPEDPVVGVARQIQAVRQLKRNAPPSLFLVGSAYSYLQEYLPHVAQAVVRERWVDAIGLGRMVLSYPGLPGDVGARATLDPRALCRTFSDCTTAPRNGLISGCYPLDKEYAGLDEARQLKQIKRGSG